MKDAVIGTHFKFALNNRVPLLSDIMCACWDCEGGGRFVLAY